MNVRSMPEGLLNKNPNDCMKTSARSKCVSTTVLVFVKTLQDDNDFVITQVPLSETKKMHGPKMLNAS